MCLLQFQAAEWGRYSFVLPTFTLFGELAVNSQEVSQIVGALLELGHLGIVTFHRSQPENILGHKM